MPASRHDSFNGIYPAAASYLPTHYRMLSRARSSLLPISDNRVPVSQNWGFFSGLRTIWSFKENNPPISGSKSFQYRSSNVPLPFASEYATTCFNQRSAPFPTSEMTGRLPYNPFRPDASPWNQHCTDRLSSPERDFANDPATQSVALGRARNPSTLSLVTVHRSKRGPPSPAPANRDEGGPAQDPVVRKRVRFAEEPLPSSDARLQMPVQLSPRARPRGYFLPFARWIAYHCNGILAEDGSSRLLTSLEEEKAGERIMKILRKYYSESGSVDGFEASTTSFLALWYMARLYPTGIFSRYDIRFIGGVEAVTRAFLLGLTLADKWLNDRSWNIKEWEKFCCASPRASNLAERIALSMLDYNIAISHAEWQRWLEALAPSTKHFESGQLNAAEALHNARREDRRINFGIRGPIISRDQVSSPKLLDDLRECLLSVH